MKHIIVFIHIFSFVVGASAMLLLTLAYMKNRNKTLKYYIYFIISLTVILIQQTVSSYDLINRFNNSYLDTVLRIGANAASGLMIYSMTLFVHNFIGYEVSKRKNLIINLISLLPILFLILFYTVSDKFLVITGGSIIFYGAILYNLCIMIKGFHKIKKERKRRVVMISLLLTAICFPYMLFDSVVENIKGISKYFPYGLASVAIFYLVWNGLSLYFVIKYFFNRINFNLENQTAQSNPIDYYYKKYNITNREREIIELLIKGHSYNSIGEELVISLPTVKTHVSNIYQKVGVKNKIELINAFKENILI